MAKKKTVCNYIKASSIQNEQKMFSDSELIILKCGHLLKASGLRKSRPESDPSSIVFVCKCGVWSAYGFTVNTENEQEVMETNTSKLREDLATHVFAYVMDKTPYVFPSYSSAFYTWGMDNTDVYFDLNERERLREEDRERRKSIERGG